MTMSIRHMKVTLRQRVTQHRCHRQSWNTRTKTAEHITASDLASICCPTMTENKSDSILSITFSDLPSVVTYIEVRSRILNACWTSERERAYGKQSLTKTVNNLLISTRAIDFSDQHESAEVIGIDLSPIQPGWVPPNCKFIIDDLESDWAYAEDDKFDFIHLRTMCGSIADWDRLLQQAYQHLKPGGWIEFQEYEAWMKSDDNSIDEANAVMEWQRLIDVSSSKFGKRMNLATEVGGYLKKAGFINVQDEGYKVCSMSRSFGVAADNQIRFHAVHGLQSLPRKNWEDTCLLICSMQLSR